MTSDLIHKIDVASPYYSYGRNIYRRKVSSNDTLQISSDFGSTWTDLYTFPVSVGIVIETLSGDIIVGADEAGYWSDPPGQVWRSDDSGATFTKSFDYTRGGFGTWSFDVVGDVVILGEYGHYDALNVYLSVDSGATWSTVFTNTFGASANVHCHKVMIDPLDSTNLYISYGDGKPGKGIWFSSDSGATWDRITDLDQPTWLVTDDKYLYAAGDLTGKITRYLKSDLGVGNFSEVVFDATDYPHYGKLSFYSGSYDKHGTVYFGGVSYGSTNQSGNNKDALLIATADHGETFAHLMRYSVNIGPLSSGAAYMSKESVDGQIYIKTNIPDWIFKFDTKIAHRIAKGVSKTARILT